MVAKENNTGSVFFDADSGALSLVGTNGAAGQIEVFNIEVSQIQRMTSLTVGSIDPAVIAVFLNIYLVPNPTDLSLTFPVNLDWPTAFSVQLKQQLIWNMPEITAINFNENEFFGHLLAPKCKEVISTSAFNGQLIVESYKNQPLETVNSINVLPCFANLFPNFQINATMATQAPTTEGPTTTQQMPTAGNLPTQSQTPQDLKGNSNRDRIQRPRALKRRFFSA